MPLNVGDRIAHYDVTVLIGEASEHRGTTRSMRVCVSSSER